MKHPFQIIRTDSLGQFLYTTVKSQIQVFDLKLGQVVGSWVDDVDPNVALQKEHQKKLNALNKDQGSDITENSEKKIKSSDSKSVKIPKIPTPGAGAPPVLNYIRALKLSRNEKYLLATTDNDKSILIFEINHDNDNCLKLIKRQSLPKRPSAITTTTSDDHVIVADKFGDVYEVKLDDNEPVKEEELQPILGHVSMLSDVEAVSHNARQFLITGDRDEHIRISNYPQAYVIRNFLFSHKEFVSCLHIPKFNSDLLISGGGDDFICIWDWNEQKLLTKIDLRSQVEKYLTSDNEPPERFKTENGKREIAVSNILTCFERDSNNMLLIVACEQVKCIFLYIADDKYNTEFIQAVEIDDKLTDICMIDFKREIIISKALESSNELVKFLKIEGSMIVDANSDTLVKTISESSTAEVHSANDIYPLYSINSLRKRSEH